MSAVQDISRATNPFSNNYAQTSDNWKKTFGTLN